MRQRDGLDYLLVAVVAVLAAVHIPPYAVAKRETVELAHETGIAAVIDLVVDIRVAVVLLALLGLVILLVVTDTVPSRE
ncbi:hypothetical protein DU500_06620 [Haloplanus rubicundus]|uniref:Uncharacterized protein n=1 Tax=Haloplanus rubicundus TaxID=1547898 RepID=A0A345EBE8_9EURY|nr:hypothetical protein [Haloplanus rubicundus]AXG06143.1 hypothetical protein DU500_06620 [Haloplanus rubicundus]AXG09520.1 hypothetical protein DU484_06350 [Haloplanus rubicundus]